MGVEIGKLNASHFSAGFLLPDEVHSVEEDDDDDDKGFFGELWPEIPQTSPHLTNR